MTNQQPTEREEILKLIRGSLQKAGQEAEKYRRLDTLLLVAGIVLGSISTALAGGIAVTGEPLTSVLDTNLASGWQIICFVVAISAAVATISSTIHKTFRVSDRLAGAMTCISSLKSMELAIIMTGADISNIVAKYTQLLHEHADILT